MPTLNQKNLKSFIETQVIKNIKKIKGKHAPIAENINEITYSLSVKSIFNLSKKLKNIFLIIVKNYIKSPKLRYFVAISLANNSSDFLVHLVRDFAIKNELNLIQYCIYPKHLRIQLLALNEVKETEDYNESIEILRKCRKEFREKLVKVNKLVENE